MQSNEELLQQLDGPRTEDMTFMAPNIDGYRKMKCTIIGTNDNVGYLGTETNQYMCIVKNIEDASNFKWLYSGQETYLQKETTPNDRYLGVGYQNQACYGLWTPTGWVNAISYNPIDHTICLKSDAKRKLYMDNNKVCWSNGEDNQNILAFEME